MTCDAATAKREEEEKRNDEVAKPEIHIFARGKKKKTKKYTDDKTVSIILSVQALPM